MPRIHYHLVSALIFTLIGVVSPAQTNDITMRFGSRDPKVRIQARDSVMDDRKKTITALMALVQKKQRYMLYDSTAVAIEALGKVRAAEASDLLADYLAIDLPVPSFEKATPENRSLAALALVEIGSEALPSLLRVVTDVEDAKSRHLAAWAISRILGSKLAPFYLQQELAEGTDETRRRHLTEALRSLEGKQ